MSASATIKDYQIRQLRLDQEVADLVVPWKHCNRRIHNETIHSDPEWLLEMSEKSNVRVFVFDSGDEVVGAVPFLKLVKPLRCQLGEITVANMPLKLLHLLGTYPNIPTEQAAYDMLFSQILDLNDEFDALYFEYVQVGSFLWEYLHSSALLKRSFRLYSPRGVLPHPLIRVSGSFEDYLRKFSPKSRKNRSREIKKLREQGKVDLEQVVTSQEVNSFVDTAAEISRKSYQYNLLGGGIRDPQLWKRRLLFAARHGWLRSYLLSCDGTACSFLIGYQFERSFYHVSVGYDPAWAHFSVGTVLQMLVLEDVFSRDQPEFYDFGTHGGYKEFFSNESYMESDFYLCSRRIYPLLAQVSHHTFRIVSRTTGAILNRFDLKQKVKKLIRRKAGHG
jgi:GNAT acetyltransferase-like protein